MTIKSDHWITAKAEIENMIYPFSRNQVTTTADGQRALSHGLSSYGYDIRSTNEFKIFTLEAPNAQPSQVIDPKNFDPTCVETRYGDECIIPANSFMLTSSLEYIHVPDNVLVVCLGKSTYARVGIIANVTPLEPGWQGNITLEFSNTTPYPVKFYANEGCVQLLFFESDERCMTTYADRRGKYQFQQGVTLAKV